MELIIAILFALQVYVDPVSSEETIRAEHPQEFLQAQNIRDNNLYSVDPETNVIIIDETGNNH